MAGATVGIEEKNTMRKRASKPQNREASPRFKVRKSRKDNDVSKAAFEALSSLSNKPPSYEPF
jgi:hypothetical protein